jgi:hypothetical protein
MIDRKARISIKRQCGLLKLPLRIPGNFAMYSGMIAAMQSGDCCHHRHRSEATLVVVK